jgi:DHA3 family macrolide efflux protein-like MFS transporter
MAGRSIFRETNLMILVAGQWVSVAGNNLFTLAVAWLVLAETHSRTALGLVSAVGALGMAAGLVSGVVADRWNRQRTMMWSDGVRAVVCAILAAAAWAGWAPAWLLAAGALALGLAGSVFGPAQAGVLPTLVAPERLAEANGVAQGAQGSAQLAGLALGGVALGIVGAAGAFAADAVSFVVSVVSVGLMRLPRTAAVPRGGASLAELRASLAEGYRHVGSSPALRRLTAVSLLLNLFLAPVNALDVAWVRQVLHQDAAVYGLFGAVLLAGLVIGAFALAAPLMRRVAFTPLAISCLTVAGAALAVFSRLPHVAPDLAMYGVFGLAIGVVQVLGETLVQRLVPNRLLGRVSGVVGAMASLAMPAGLAAAGIVASLMPLAQLFLAGGVLFALSSLLAIGVTWEEGVQQAAVS